MFVVFVSPCVTVTLHINFISFADILKIPVRNCVFYCSYYIMSIFKIFIDSQFRKKGRTATTCKSKRKKSSK